MNQLRQLTAILCIGALGTTVLHAQPAQPATGPITVQVSQPIEETVTPYEDFAGRTEAVQTVHIQPRLSGTLERILFKEGSLVKKGDLLFELDSRACKADVDRAMADVLRAEAVFMRHKAEEGRARKLRESNVLGETEFDKVLHDLKEAEAGVRVAQANLEKARLQMDAARIVSPIDGRIDRSLAAEGDVVSADPARPTLLTTVVSTDPMVVYFSVSEELLPKLTKKDKPVPVHIGLVGDKGFPIGGVVNYVANRVDPNTGTIQMRAVFSWKDSEVRPGMFARVRLSVGNPVKALLAPDAAVGRALGKDIVYVVDDQGKVSGKFVTVGQLHGGLRAIKEGLKADDWVVVRPAADLKTGDKVKTERVPLPRP
jgi:RND family efflux transporter MFP subunit